MVAFNLDCYSLTALWSEDHEQEDSLNKTLEIYEFDL